MGDKITLSVKVRETRGKKVARLRRDGLVPGVIYGHKLEPIMTEAPYNIVEKVVRDAGRHTPVHVTVDGKKKIAMIKNVDRDPVGSKIRHVSFHAVKANEIVTAEVPIRLTGEGESPAERAGLIVLQALEQVEIKALPADLPEALEISVIGLETDDDRLTLADIVLPAGVEYADIEQDVDLVIANVYEPAALQAANEDAGGDEEVADAADVPSDNGEADADAPASDDDAKDEKAE